MEKPIARAVLAGGLCLTLAGWPAFADEPVSLQGKTATMIIAATGGAGTDFTGRIFAKYFSKYLPGSPTFISQNMPAGHGVTALNYLTEQGKPDGTAVSVASASQIDPITYRTPQAKYNPTELTIVGSIGPGDTVLIIRADALPRLMDKSKPPVTMGSVSGIPRTSMRMNMWGTAYLGWNTKWVVGYPGSSDLALALERSEIEMTAFPKSYLVDKLTDTNKYKVIYSDAGGDEGRPTGRADLDSVASLNDALVGKITDPKIMEGYEYWRAGVLVKWLALPPKTPLAVREAYRTAFNATVADPEFTTAYEKAAPGYTVVSAEATEKLISDLAKTTPEAMDAVDDLLRKQGVNIPKNQNH